jgi:pre-mRNA-splicing factor SYF1
MASNSAMGVIDDLMPKEEDLLYEEELLRNPYSLKLWWRYIQARPNVSAKRRYLLYERALKSLPGSYKVSMHCCCSVPCAVASNIDI